MNINYGLDLIRREVEDFDSLIIRKLLVDLYVKFFTFLTQALLFFCSKTERMKASIRKGFYDKNVVALVEDVGKTMQHIHNETRRITQSRVRNVDTKMDHLGKRLDLVVAAVESRKSDSLRDERKWLEVTDKLVTRLQLLGFTFAQALGAAEQQTLFQYGESWTHRLLCAKC